MSNGPHNGATEEWEKEPMYFTEEEHEACTASLGMEAMPPMFTEIILQQRANGASPSPVVVAVCPAMSREEFIRTLPENHPARIALKKEQNDK